MKEAIIIAFVLGIIMLISIAKKQGLNNNKDEFHL